LKIRTIIIDDEPHAREGIKIRLKDYYDILVVGECSSGTEAVELINSVVPDLLFIDIQMPGMNGFEVLRNITINPMPIIIFVTAYDKYAVRAFEYHALDYLLKPINDERFNETLKRAVSEINNRSLAIYADKLKSLIDYYLNSVENSEVKETKLAKNKKYINRLTIKVKENISIISVDEVDWIESAGDYVYIHTDTKKYLIRETLSSLEEKLDPLKFVRIHRSTIVNIDKIKNLRSNEHGDYDVYLYNGVRLKLSRTFRSHFQNLLGNSF
jgi:two-component system LytT family response regulator